MTTFDTSGNILTEVQDISNYTIPGTISDATFLRFLTKAEEQVTLDDPGFLLAQCTEAVALYICHLIYRKTGRIGVTSEHISAASVSFKLTSDSTPWLDEYKMLIERVRRPRVSLKTLDTNGIMRDDIVISQLKNDQAVVVVPNGLPESPDPALTLGDLVGYP